MLSLNLVYWLRLLMAALKSTESSWTSFAKSTKTLIYLSLFAMHQLLITFPAHLTAQGFWRFMLASIRLPLEDGFKRVIAFMW